MFLTGYLLVGGLGVTGFGVVVGPRNGKDTKIIDAFRKRRLTSLYL